MTDIRKAFEARSVPNLNLKRNDDGAYHYGVTRMAYRDFCDGYQAGRADERKRVMDEICDKDIEFLREAARYFLNRDTGGEDKAHWANVYNAENCNRIADKLSAIRKALNEGE